MKKTRPGDSNSFTRDYFDSVLIEMSHIGTDKPDPAFHLYGRRFATPVMTAALSHLNDCHPEGMTELARGAFMADTVMWAGMGDEQELESITSTGAKTIKIIKPYRDNKVIYERIAHAKSCGCIAVGIDTDHAMNSRGGYDIVQGLEMRPKSLREIRSFAEAAEIPFIVKGVLSVRDALLCMEAGVGGVVVSHHHGIMDFAVPPLMVLPDIVKAIAGHMPVFLDCGVESGYDVYKAIAIGATAVSVGRALMPALSSGGAKAAAEKIQDLTGELMGVMAHTAAIQLKDITPSVIRFRKP